MSTTTRYSWIFAVLLLCLLLGAGIYWAFRADSSTSATQWPHSATAQGWRFLAQERAEAAPAFFHQSIASPQGFRVRRVAQSAERARHEYTTKSPESPDGQYYYYWQDADTGRKLLIHRVDNGDKVGQLDRQVNWNSDITWSADSAAIWVLRAANGHSTGDLHLRRYALDGRLEEDWDLGPELLARFPSADAIGTHGGFSVVNQRVGVHVRRGQKVLGFVLLDLSLRQIQAQLDLAEHSSWFNAAEGGKGQILLSPNGDYIAASICHPKDEHFTAWDGCDGGIFNQDFSQRIISLAQMQVHGTFAQVASGTLWLAWNADSGALFSRNLNTGKQRIYRDLYALNPREKDVTSMHLSAQNLDQPGFAVLSFFSTHIAGQVDAATEVTIARHPLRNQIVLLDLERGEVLPLAQSQVCMQIADFWYSSTFNYSKKYWSMPHAVANRDLSRVYFATDWQQCNGLSQLYRLELSR